MTARFFGGSAAAALVWIAGCGSTPTVEPTGQSTEGVQGGSVDRSHSYAVGVCIGTGPGQCNYLCSGALIAPNLVVSARHCVSNVPNPMGVDCVNDRFGSDLGPQVWITTDYQLLQSSTGWHRVQKRNLPSDNKLCGNDISLLILADNVKDTEARPVTPGVQYSMTDHSRFSTSVTAIGYGNTQVFADPSRSDAGIRHIRQDINIVCIPGDPSIDCGNLDGGAGLTANEFYSGDGTCEGDSGSSAYEQTSFTASEAGGGRPISFGVLSRGGQYRTTCSGGIYTRLDKFRDLIVASGKEAASLGGYAVPAWTANPSTKPDGGVPRDGGPAPGSLGASCTDDKQCDSKQCVSADGTNFVCSITCVEGATPSVCGSGFACKGGYCFVAPDAKMPNGAAPSSGGCAVSPRDPTKPVPWRALGLGALGVLLLRRRSARRGVTKTRR